MKKTVKLTQLGYDEKQQEFAKLKSERVQALAELVRAREMGDLSENAAYKVARSKLSGIDRRIRFLESILKRVEVVQKRTDGKAGIGSVVTFAENNTSEVMCTLVDGYESDIGKGKISIYSPIGRAFLGRNKGDIVNVAVPAGKKQYRIISIE